MKPTWQSDCGTVSLYLADCLGVLPNLLGVDAVVTDPPYGIAWDGINHGCINNRGAYNGYREVASRIKEEAEIQSDAIPFDPAPLTDRWECCFTGAQHFYDRLPPHGSLHCWNKKGTYKPMDHGDGDIVWCSRRRCSRIFDLVWRGLCRHAEQSERFEHPTQKPIALMAWMIELCGEPETTLDPFMGSGTTGVAAVRLGRKFIGVEIEERYFNIAKKRIIEALNSQPLFKDQEPQATQRILEGVA